MTSRYNNIKATDNVGEINLSCPSRIINVLFYLCTDAMDLSNPGFSDLIFAHLLRVG